MITLLKTNLKTLFIHALSILLFTLLLTLFVALSPLYKGIGEMGAKIVAGLLYALLYAVNIWAILRFLKGPFKGYHILFSSVLIILFGLIFWGLAMKTVQYNLQASFEENPYIWIPYNVYHGLLWPLAYGEQTPLFKLMMCFVNGIMAPLSMALKVKFNKNSI